LIEEQHIRERAHSIWESEGRPSGQADAHWALASAQLTTEAKRTSRSAPRKAAAATAAAPRVKSEAAPRKPRKTAATA
jgi:hypothetical protein